MFATHRKFQSGTGKGRAGFVGLQLQETTSVGNVDAGVDDLMSVTLEADTLYKKGCALRIYAFGTTGGNGNNKTVKLLFGGQEVFTTGVLAANDKDWMIEAFVVRRATVARVYAKGIANDTLIAPVYSELTVDFAVDNIIKCTGEAVATDDIIQKAMLVETLTT